jgi:hypothetical protein
MPLGAATSLALALLVGGRVFAAMKRSLGAGEWVRRGLGVAVLVAVVGDRAGARYRPADPGLARQHGKLEQGLIDRLADAGAPKPAVVRKPRRS